MQQSEPRIRRLPRRRFLEVVGLSAGVTAAGLAIVTTRREAASLPPAPTDVPVQNPAFREAPGTAPGRTIVYCQTPGAEPIAFELNARAAAIWSDCVSHADFARGNRKTLAELSDLGLGSAEELSQFVFVMASRGLVFLADSETQVYFEFEERHG